MADDWDPFAMDGEEEAAPAASASAPVAVENSGGYGEGKVSIPEEAFATIINTVRSRLNQMEDKPWLDFEKAASPDLSLYTPTCSLEDWKHQDVDLVIGKGIAYIILNRPEENNSITDSVNAAYCDAVHGLHSRPDIRVVVLTGRGKMFCSGMDPNWDGVPTQARSAEALEAADKLIAKALKTGIFADKEQASMVPFGKANFNFCQLPQLTIGMLNGSVMGQGIGFVCSCDLVISIKSAFFSLTDVKVGLVPTNMAPYLTLKTSNNMAKRLMMLGETFDAQTAKERGFVQYVVDDMAQAHGVLKEVCGRVTDMSPIAIQKAKKLAYGVSGHPVLEAVMWHTLKYFNESLATTFVEGDARPWQKTPIEPVEPGPW